MAHETGIHFDPNKPRDKVIRATLEAASRYAGYIQLMYIPREQWDPAYVLVNRDNITKLADHDLTANISTAFEQQADHLFRAEGDVPAAATQTAQREVEARQTVMLLPDDLQMLELPDMIVQVYQQAGMTERSSQFEGYFQQLATMIEASASYIERRLGRLAEHQADQLRGLEGNVQLAKVLVDNLREVAQDISTTPEPDHQTAIPDEVVEKFLLGPELYHRRERIKSNGQTGITEEYKDRMFMAVLLKLGDPTDASAEINRKFAQKNLERLLHQPLFELTRALYLVGGKEMRDLMNIVTIKDQLTSIDKTEHAMRERLVEVFPLADWTAQLTELRGQENPAALVELEKKIVRRIQQVVSQYRYEGGSFKNLQEAGEVSSAEIPLDQQLNCIEFSTVGFEFLKMLGINARAIGVFEHSILLVQYSDQTMQWLDMQNKIPTDNYLTADLFNGGQRTLDQIKDIMANPAHYPEGLVVYMNDLATYRTQVAGDWVKEDHPKYVYITPAEAGPYVQHIEWLYSYITKEKSGAMDQYMPMHAVLYDVCLALGGGKAHNTLLHGAQALAIAGDFAMARKVAEQYQTLYPQPTLVTAVFKFIEDCRAEAQDKK